VYFHHVCHPVNERPAGTCGKVCNPSELHLEAPSLRWNASESHCSIRDESPFPARKLHGISSKSSVGDLCTAYSHRCTWRPDLTMGMEVFTTHPESKSVGLRVLSYAHRHYSVIVGLDLESYRLEVRKKPKPAAGDVARTRLPQSTTIRQHDNRQDSTTIIRSIKNNLIMPHTASHKG